jgi:hypothetical protein
MKKRRTVSDDREQLLHRGSCSRVTARTYSFPAYAPVGTHEFRSIEACSLKQLLRGLFVAVAESNQRRSRDSSPLK